MRNSFCQILFIGFLLFPQFVWGRDHCDDRVVQLQRSACLAQCEIYYQENPEARPESQKGVCENTKDLLASSWDFRRNKERFQSCASGAWKGVLSLPEQFKAYLMLVSDLGTAIKAHTQERQKFLAECEKDRACRREVARQQIHFRERRPDGSYVVPDSEVDRAIANENFYSLMMISAEHQSLLQRSCQTQLHSIDQKLENSREFEEWNLQALRERYRQIAAWDPSCPGALRMQFPADPEEKKSGPGWLESLNIKRQCHSPEIVNELVCLEIAQFILDPLALGTAGTGLAAKAVAKAGLKIKSGLRATEEAALAASKERRLHGGAEALSRERGGSAISRSTYTQRHLEKRVTTVEQNEEWIRLAESSSGGERFVEVENSMMKNLNDTLKDKNLVTSLTNRHHELTMEEMMKVAQNNPGLEVVPYSDFKSTRYAFRGKLPEDLDDQVNRAFQSANAEFTKEIKDLKLVRESDRPDLWFRAGIADTADGASAAARVGRSQGSANRLMNLSQPAVRERLNRDLQMAEAMRSKIEQSWGSSPLLAGKTGNRVPTREAFDLVRKSQNSEELHRAIQSKYQLSQFSRSDAELLMNYAKSIDAFSPSLRIARRETVTLDDAVHGGFSADFLGLGSANSQATAAALAGKKDVQGALKSARQGEKQVTQEFRQRLEAFRKTVGDIARCSGDDCVGVAARPLTNEDKMRILQGLAAQPETRSIRMSFIEGGIRDPAHRSQLSNHGESIEKALRVELRGVISAERAEAMTFGIDMKTKVLHQGSVDLLIGTRTGTSVTAEEAQRIREALARAVQKVNKQLQAEGVPASYQAIP